MLIFTKAFKKHSMPPGHDGEPDSVFSRVRAGYCLVLKVTHKTQRILDVVIHPLM